VYPRVFESTESDNEDDDNVQPFEALSEQGKIDRARGGLRFKYNVPEEDFRAVNFAIEVGRYAIPPVRKIDKEDHADICTAIRKRKEADAARALVLVQQAQSSDKSKALSQVEQLVFVQCKAMVRFRTAFDMDMRKRMFQLLTARGDNWWDKHNSSALARI
jgi:hypothetical protein